MGKPPHIPLRAVIPVTPQKGLRMSGHVSLALGFRAKIPPTLAFSQGPQILVAFCHLWELFPEIRVKRAGMATELWRQELRAFLERIVRIWGLGFGVWGLGFGVWGLGFGVWGLGFGVWGLGFGV